MSELTASPATGALWPDSVGARWRWGLALVGIWLVPGLLQCLQEVTYARAHGAQDVSHGRILLHFLPSWVPWALFTPAVLALSRRFPLGRASLLRNLPVHLAACLVFGFGHTLLLGLVRTRFPPGPWAPPDLGPWLANTLWSLHSQVEVLAYAGVVIAGQASWALRQARAKELGAARLQAQLSEARLTALRGQLQPHFLFNTLNSIDVLMVDDPQRAGTMLHRLSDLLRRTLESAAPVHTLHAELEHLRCYVEIERVRFSDRLGVSYDVDDETLELAVPSLILQPLLENAIRHGIAPRARGGSLRVAARLVGDALELTVEDDGVGFDDHSHEGIGLGNTRARLAELYGDRQSLEISASAAGGVTVSVRLPASVPSAERREL